ncbi:MAG: hypothetical protein WCV72_04200 [Patescibacteria group bacterium]
MSNLDKTYFSEIFNVDHSIVESYGALDISLVCDNPAFVDPFLIFANPEYKNLHDFIIEYLKFLRDLSQKSDSLDLEDGIFKHYYKFPEVKEVWLGYSAIGNAGLGNSKVFADSLYRNLNKIFSNFGKEKEGITKSQHLEKLCLIEEGIGVDKISDFTINLIKEFFLRYTEKFAQKHIDKSLLKEFAVPKVSFDFENQIWKGSKFILPYITRNGKEQFVLLVPKDIIAKYDTWISRNDFLKNDTSIFASIENDEIRAKINKYFNDQLNIKITKHGQEKDFSKKSRKGALQKTMREFPAIVDYYIRYKESEEDKALENNLLDAENVDLYLDVANIKRELRKRKFGKITVIDDCIQRILFFKQTLESNSNSLYLKEKSLQEKQLQLMFKNATYGSLFDYNSEVNNGRGPIDFIVSFGINEKIGIEFKLASNSKLKQNLLNQGKVYQDDSNLKHVIKVIFFFSNQDLEAIQKVLSVLKKSVDNREIFLIDCRKKESASNQK